MEQNELFEMNRTSWNKRVTVSGLAKVAFLPQMLMRRTKLLLTTNVSAEH